MPASRDPRIHFDPADLRARMRGAPALSFGPRQPTNSALNGRHASRLKGRGLNFEELRRYIPGDDVRTIDWKVTARTGNPHVRVYTEERDRPVLLIVDQRLSMFFGTVHAMKSVVAAESAALSAFRVRAGGDRVGGLIFGDDRVDALRPKASARALDRFLDTLSAANARLRADAPGGAALRLEDPLRAASRLVTSGMLVLMFSDFDGWSAEAEKHLRDIARRAELVLFSVTDPAARQLYDTSTLIVSDGRLQAPINLGDETVRERLSAFNRDRLMPVFAFSRRFGVPVVPLSTARDALPQLLELIGGAGARP